MSLYFEYPTDLAEKNAGQVLAVAWSQNDHPIMAVSTKKGTISMFHEEGERLDADVSIKREGECHAMAWHPRFSILASGWDDGIVPKLCASALQRTNTHMQQAQ